MFCFRCQCVFIGDLKNDFVVSSYCTCIDLSLASDDLFIYIFYPGFKYIVLELGGLPTIFTFIYSASDYNLCY